MGGKVDVVKGRIKPAAQKCVCEIVAASERDGYRLRPKRG